MRPRNEDARDRLDRILARRAGVGAAELAEALDVSIPTLHRLLAERRPDVVVAGRARRTRYALRRALRGERADIPLYEVNESGRAHATSLLALVQPQGSWMNLAGGWPVPEESIDGWWPGLPYPLYDMRPQGYMGRQFARAEHRALGVPPDPDLWNDDDIVQVLRMAGSDVSGNLILGDAAYERWQSTAASTEPLASRAIARTYVTLAEQAVAMGGTGSSVAGEFPKFSAIRECSSSRTPHVLVKFSGSSRSAAVHRWSDLLVCEHLALQAISQHLNDVQASRSRILQHAGRTFLEVERFDRHGLFGRSRLLSLTSLDAALIGDGAGDWTRVASTLTGLGFLSADDAHRIARLWWFGRLIANTDMHAGNLSFVPLEETPGRPQVSLTPSGGLTRSGKSGSTFNTLTPAPAYDMLPMLYAPLPGGEVPPRRYEPPLPLPAQREAWNAGCIAALAFWKETAIDSRISTTFRRQCTANAAQLARTADRA